MVKFETVVGFYLIDMPGIGERREEKIRFLRQVPTCTSLLCAFLDVSLFLNFRSLERATIANLPSHYFRLKKKHAINYEFLSKPQTRRSKGNQFIAKLKCASPQKYTWAYLHCR